MGVNGELLKEFNGSTTKETTTKTITKPITKTITKQFLKNAIFYLQSIYNDKICHSVLV